jgi:hypothetical protein
LIGSVEIGFVLLELLNDVLPLQIKKNLRLDINYFIFLQILKKMEFVYTNRGNSMVWPCARKQSSGKRRYLEFEEGQVEEAANSLHAVAVSHRTLQAPHELACSSQAVRSG